MRTLKDQIRDLEKGVFQNTLHLQAVEEYCSQNLYAGLLLAMAQLEAFVDYFKTLDPDKYGKMTEFVAKRSREIAEIQFERMQKKMQADDFVPTPVETSESEPVRDLEFRKAEQEAAIDASRAVQSESVFSGIKVREG